MLPVFSAVKGWLKKKGPELDGPIFRLHTTTAALLVVFSAILATRQYVGNPIDCVHTKDIDEDVLNAYCWIHSTYTMRSAFRNEIPHIYPGVGTSQWRRSSEGDVKFYPYYQWALFCLFFQVSRLF